MVKTLEQRFESQKKTPLSLSEVIKRMEEKDIRELLTFLVQEIDEINAKLN